MSVWVQIFNLEVNGGDLNSLWGACSFTNLKLWIKSITIRKTIFNKDHSANSMFFILLCFCVEISFKAWLLFSSQLTFTYFSVVTGGSFVKLCKQTNLRNVNKDIKYTIEYPLQRPLNYLGICKNMESKWKYFFSFLSFVH